MRVLLILLTLSLCGVSSAAYWFYHDSLALERTTNDLHAQSERLLQEVDHGTRTRLGLEKQIENLRMQIAESNSRIAELDAELASTQELIDPDYADVEAQIRRRLEAAYRERVAEYEDRRESTPQTITEVMTGLSNLEASERMALLSVQAQYGSFLDSLNVTPQRRDEIAATLINLVQSQREARQDLIAQQLPPREMREQMMTLMQPDTFREALSYELTENELAQFDATQQQTPTTVTAGPIGERGVFMIRGEGPNAVDFIQQGRDILINSDISTDGTTQSIILQAQPLPQDN